MDYPWILEERWMNHWTFSQDFQVPTATCDFDVTSPRQVSQPSRESIKVWSTSSEGLCHKCLRSVWWDHSGIRWDSLLNSMKFKDIQRHHVCFAESLEFPYMKRWDFSSNKLDLIKAYEGTEIRKTSSKYSDRVHGKAYHRHRCSPQL